MIKKSAPKKKAKKPAIKGSTGDRLIELFDKKLTSLTITSEVKRMTMPNGLRDWTVRVCWEATRGEKTYSCKWEGFETSEDAIKDLLKRFKAPTSYRSKPHKP